MRKSSKKEGAVEAVTSEYPVKKRAVEIIKKISIYKEI